MNNFTKSQSIATPTCPFLSVSKDKEYSWDIDNTNISKNIYEKFAFVQTAEAASPNQSTFNTSNLHTISFIPFFLTVVFFFLFISVMSVVYVYHWSNFNMGDKFIKNYITIYFIGLVFLLIPFLVTLLS